MRIRANVHVAIAMIALACAAGCGDNENETIFIGDATPTAALRTATPGAGRTATPAVAATATPAATSTGAGPTSTGSSVTPTSGGTPGPTATPGGAASVEAVVGDVLPFLTVGAGLAVGVSSSALTAGRTAEAVKVDNCPDGGTRTDDEGVPVKTVTLDQCAVSNAQLGSFEFTGTIVIKFLAGTIDFDFTSTDLSNDRQVHFVGTLQGTPQSGGFVLNGPVTVTTPQGNFTLTLSNLTVDSDHKLVSGSGTANDDDDNFDLKSVSMTVNSGGQTADVLATFDDDSTQTFLLNLETGELTPTS